VAEDKIQAARSSAHTRWRWLERGNWGPGSQVSVNMSPLASAWHRNRNKYLQLVCAGELALCGCTVRVHDRDPLNLQTVHSRISEQLGSLREAGQLPHDSPLPV
jgi:hypothetical protein